MILRLSEWYFGERVLTAVLYENVKKENGEITKLFHCYKQKFVLLPTTIECLFRPFDKTLESSDFKSNWLPWTEETKEKFNKLDKEMEPYRGNTLTIGEKQYSIFHVVDRMFYPWIHAPDIELTQEETKLWQEELSKWDNFDDETYGK